QAGLDAARSVNYQNAGTVELLVSGDQFYFLEMNTRIQVEHPVTEAVTGVDLVELQFKVAQGEALPLTQSDVGFSGHAIEFRIYAEDPAAGFVPTAGTIEKLERPQSEGLREDGAVEEGDKISVFYDAMISKIIVSAESRSACMEKSREILSGYVIKGLTTTLDYHLWLTYNSGFRNRPVDIGFVERELRGNPDFIREYRASRIRDPLHQEPIGGAEVKNVYQYVSKKFGETYTIEVVHKADGSFLLIPMDLNGERAAREEDCRRSNGFQKALSSVIKVLETKSPQELFAHCH
ncbi:MAG: hypothetical protein KDD42_09600, partial [Bdellovibrionales bacterium]|nr:hypothetical protein [Bdellovibrionales bacterium]